MVSIKAGAFKLQTDLSTGELMLCASVVPGHRKQLQEAYASLKDKSLRLDIKEWRDKRSLDANAYLWVLCDKIAEVNNTTKEYVYQTFVKDVGVFDVLLVRNDAKEAFKNIWNSRGLGWFAEEMDGSRIENCTRVIVYYGSSSYDTKQMSRLIDHAVQVAESLDIPTLPDSDIKKLKEEWADEVSPNKGL